VNHNGSACPLLRDGLCVLYASRPVICRTHGLPLLLRLDGEQRVDCCLKNFKNLHLADLPGSSLLDLERLNLVLASVNYVFSAARGIDPLHRHALTELWDID